MKFFFISLVIEINFINEEQGENFDLLGIQLKFFINMFMNCMFNYMMLDEYWVNIIYDIINLYIVGIRRCFQCQIVFFVCVDFVYFVFLINIMFCFVIKCCIVIYGNFRMIYVFFFIGYINNNSCVNVIFFIVNIDQFYIGVIVCILDFKFGNFNLFDQFLIVSINGIEVIYYMMFMYMCC